MTSTRTQRGTCPECGRDRALAWDRERGWVIRYHRALMPAVGNCPGSGQQAAEGERPLATERGGE